MSETPPEHTPAMLTLGRIIVTVVFKITLPILIIVAAVYGGYYLMNNTKKAERKKRERLATLVSVTPAIKVSEPVIIEAMGTVIPSKQLQLRPQVAGPIESVGEGLEPGAFFSKDEVLLTIEAKDYDLQVAQRIQQVAIAESRVTEAQKRLSFAERDLQIEKGRQAIARKDLEALGQEIDPENEALVLRVPQLKAMEAEIEASKAAVSSAEAELEVERSRLEEAKLNQARVKVKTPYNMVIEEKFVDAGDRVSTSTALVHMVGTDAFWIELSVPVRQLKWIEFPKKGQEAEKAGSKVTISSSAWPEDKQRTGYVLRLLPQVDREGRLAKVLVEVKDPLCLKPENQGLQPLLANSFVEAEIHGKVVSEVIRVPRKFVRNGDQLWLMNEEDQLDINTINVVYRAREYLYVDQGVEDGDRIIDSSLSTPVSGMTLRIAADRKKKAVGDDDAESPTTQPASAVNANADKDKAQKTSEGGA